MSSQTLLLLASATVAACVGLGFSLWVSVLDAMNQKYEANLQNRMRQVGMDASALPTWMRARIILGVLGALFVAIVLEMVPVGLVVGVLIYRLVPAILEWRIETTKALFREQTVSVARNLAGQVRGQAISVAGFRRIAAQTDAPMGVLMREAVTKIDQSVPFKDVLTQMKDRVQMDYVTLLVITLIIAQEKKQGPDLADILDNIAHSLTENQRVDRKRETDTAAGRRVVNVLTVFPAAFLLGFYVLDPEATGLVFSTLAGQFVICVVIGIVWFSRWLANNILREVVYVVAFTPGLWALAGSGLVALAVLALGLQIYWIITVRRPDDRLPFMEARRRQLLRLRSTTYLLLEPLVDDLVWLIRAINPQTGSQLRRDLTLVEPPRPRTTQERWEPEEFVALKVLEGLPSAIPAAAFGYILGGWVMAIFLGALAIVVIPWVLLRDVTKRAQKYRADVRSRLAMVVDLMALMLEAEATLSHSLDVVAQENREHPIGELFKTLQEMVDQTVPREEALKYIAEMLDDSDVNELVFTLTASAQSEDLKGLLRSLVAPMRTRRIQQLEQASEQAKVNITYPALVIMIACLLIVVTLFGLPVGQAP